MRLAAPERIRSAVQSHPAVKRGCGRVATQLEVRAREIAYAEAYDTGEYAAGIGQVPTVGPGAVVRAGDRKSYWIERGTGVHGPKHRPIRPKHGKYLVFRVPAGAPRASMSGTRQEGGLVFAKEVQGRPALRILERAARQVADRPGRRFRLVERWRTVRR